MCVVVSIRRCILSSKIFDHITNTKLFERTIMNFILDKLQIIWHRIINFHTEKKRKQLIIDDISAFFDDENIPLL